MECPQACGEGSCTGECCNCVPDILSSSSSSEESTSSSSSDTREPFCQQFPEQCPDGKTPICEENYLCVNIPVEDTDQCREIKVHCPAGTRLECPALCGENSCNGRCCTCVPESSPPLTYCTNGRLEPGEECDDGNRNDVDNCSNTCRKGVGMPCTDNIQCVTDLCKDGICTACFADDECPSGKCVANRCMPLCGNGQLDPGEGCDDGDRDNNDACTNNCKLQNGQRCVENGVCVSQLCRNGICSPCNKNEDCPTGFCLNRMCTAPPICGNGRQEFREMCDDGNNDNFDQCGNNCRLGNGSACTGNRQCQSLLCKDGICQPCGSDSECSSRKCVNGQCSEHCGNGAVDSGEECDQGGGNSDIQPDACRTDCTAARCGDGLSDGNEQCDDGNLVSGDGCDRFCRIEVTGVAIDLDTSQLTADALARSRPPAGQTGPGALAVMAAGGAAGWAWVRRRRMK